MKRYLPVTLLLASCGGTMHPAVTSHSAVTAACIESLDVAGGRLDELVDRCDRLLDTLEEIYRDRQ